MNGFKEDEHKFDLIGLEEGGGEDEIEDEAYFTSKYSPEALERELR